MTTNSQILENLPTYEPVSPSNIPLCDPLPTVQSLVQSYQPRYGSLFRAEGIDEMGTIREDASSGAILTS